MSTLDTSDRIGPYRILQVLGEGGMGVVYQAEQVEPVRRMVALKVLRVGMDSKTFTARFDAERQALAMMDHPNIARVLDAGDADGRPYYVLELVHGSSLTEFCDTHRLSTKQRLGIFLDLCGAVHHAHQRGIIHRDLKPSNVLVALQDDRPVPKVIDFGIAKAIGHRLTEHTLVTSAGEAIGTPAYMSPEQWDSQVSDIDTRADIYSLGVILYELLSGQLPYDPLLLIRAGGAAPYVIRDTAVVPPSGRVKEDTPATGEVARLRSTDRRALTRDLNGDLDWISLKAIDPDRRRRYETAHELANDIGRHLRSEPVLARPPSARYRVGRFVARHRVGTTVGAMAVLALATIFTQRVVQTNRLALERDRARTEADKARALNAFLVETFLSPDPLGGMGRGTTMLQALDAAAGRLERDKLTSPSADASMRSAIGHAYYGLAVYDKAQALLSRSLVERDSISPRDSSAIAQSALWLGDVYEKLGKDDSASGLFDRAVAIYRAMGQRTAEAADAFRAVGRLAAARGDSTGAVPVLEEAARVYAAVGDTMGSMQTEVEIGVVEYQRGHLPQAERHLRTAAAGLRHMGKLAQVAEVLTSLGVVLEDSRQPVEAEATLREALSTGETALGPDHDLVTAALNNLGELLSTAGRNGEAATMLRRALAIDEKKLGKSSPDVAIDLINLSRALCGAGPSEEGAAMAERARAIYAARTAADQWKTYSARGALGVCLTRLRRFDEADRELQAAIRGLTKALGPTHWRVDSAKARLAELDRIRKAPK